MTPEIVVRLRVVWIDLECPAVRLLRLGILFFVKEQHAVIVPGVGPARVQFDGSLEMLPGLGGIAGLSVETNQVDMNLHVIGIGGQSSLMLADGLGIAAGFFQLHAALEVRGGAVIQLVNPFEQRVVQRRFDGGIGGVLCQLLLRFRLLPEPAEYTGEGEMSGAVPRKELAGFGIAARRGFVIALGHLHPPHAVPGLRRIAMLVEDLPVSRAGGVPVGDRGQTLGKPQLCG